MLRTLCLIAALAAVSSPAWAQTVPHNPAQQQACEADAHRFCQKEIPDEFLVGSCLQKHRHRLTRACREALQSRH